MKRNRFDLLIELVKTSFKMRYQNSILGLLWVLVKPYSTFIVLYFVWTRIVNADIPNYSLFLLSGIVVFTFFNELIILGQMALLDRAGIILKVNFPRQIAVLSALITAIINLFINIILIVVIGLITGIEIQPLGLLYFVFVALIFFLFGLGIAFFTSVATIKFRDLKNVVELGMFLLYWATPIFYTVDTSKLVDSRFAKIIAYNPLGILINQARAGLNVYGEINLGITFGFFLIALGVVILGWFYFQDRVKKIAEHF